MSRYADLLGTVFSKFKLGIGGPQLKNNAGDIEARDSADSAYAAIAASLFKTYGNDFTLNAGAAGSGADWTFKLTRPSTGQSQNLDVVFPGADPSPGQTLAVDTLAGGTITLKWQTVSGGSNGVMVDKTSLAFGSASPLAMFTLPANAVLLRQQIIIDTPFDGAPTLSVGVTGTASKYLGSTMVDLTAAAGTVFEVEPGLAADASSEALEAAYSAGGATAGAARLLTFFGNPG